MFEYLSSDISPFLELVKYCDSANEFSLLHLSVCLCVCAVMWLCFCTLANS